MTPTDNFDINTLITQVLQEADPGTLVIVKLFDEPPVDNNMDPFEQDATKTRLRMASGGGNANYESHVPFVSQGLPFPI
jgi:hypothetical protein